MAKPSLAALVLALALIGSARAEDFPAGDPAAEFEKGFGEATGMQASDQAAMDADRLQLGGTLWSEFLYLKLDPALGQGGYVSNPNTLWLTLDAKLKGDVRAFARLQTVYDPTQSGGVNPLSGRAGQATTTDLQELKLQFTVEKRVFFTVGKQKLKWGVGKFWNPTDFLNATPRNFLYSSDLRSGLPLVKTHVPIGSSNFYLVQGWEGANRPGKIRHAARAEIPIGPGEISATVMAREGLRPSFGLDASSALGPIDVYAEGAWSAGNERTFYGPLGASTDPDRPSRAWVAGLSYELAYSDSDTVILGAEYFRNELGYPDRASYPYVFLGGGYLPFQLGQDYAMLLAMLAKPGSWEHVTLTFSNILALGDGSAMSRVDALYTGFDDLSLNLALAAHYGRGDGEFKLGGQQVDAAFRLMVSF